MTTILTKPAVLGDTQLSGQVVVLDIDGVQLGAPTLKKPWWKFNVESLIPQDAMPGGDVRWMQQATLYVVAVFPEGTFDVAAISTGEAR